MFFADYAFLLTKESNPFEINILLKMQPMSANNSIEIEYFEEHSAI